MLHQAPVQPRRRQDNRQPERVLPPVEPLVPSFHRFRQQGLVRHLAVACEKFGRHQTQPDGVPAREDMSLFLQRPAGVLPVVDLHPGRQPARHDEPRDHRREQCGDRRYQHQRHRHA
jgi:hypothetical protein